MNLLNTLYGTTGLSMLTFQQTIMIIVALLLLYLAIKREYEPYLLLPIAFGMLLANLPGVPNEGIMEKGGLLYYLYQGVKLGIYWNNWRSRWTNSNLHDFKIGTTHARTNSCSSLLIYGFGTCNSATDY